MAILSESRRGPHRENEERGRRDRQPLFRWAFSCELKRGQRSLALIVISQAVSVCDSAKVAFDLVPLAAKSLHISPPTA